MMTETETAAGIQRPPSETAEDYPVIAAIDDGTRVIECPAGIQWIVQRRSGGRWHGRSFCRTKEALIRIAGNHPALARLPNTCGADRPPPPPVPLPPNNVPKTDEKNGLEACHSDLSAATHPPPKRQPKNAPSTPSPHAYLSAYGFVYFIADADHIKIGRATDPIMRLSDLQVGNPRRLVLLKVIPGGYRAEAEWHERFAELRFDGEWFRAEASLKQAIKEAKPAEKYRDLTRHALRSDWKPHASLKADIPDIPDFLRR